MHMKQHPLAKTSQDVRRSIARLKNYTVQFPNMSEEEFKAVSEAVRNLERVREAIPEEHRDVDLKRG